MPATPAMLCKGLRIEPETKERVMGIAARRVQTPNLSMLSPGREAFSLTISHVQIAGRTFLIGVCALFTKPPTRRHCFLFPLRLTSSSSSRSYRLSMIWQNTSRLERESETKRGGSGVCGGGGVCCCCGLFCFVVVLGGRWSIGFEGQSILIEFLRQKSSRADLAHFRKL